MKNSIILILNLGFLCIFSWNSCSGSAGELQSGVVKYDKAKSFDGYNFYTNYRTGACLMDMTGHVVHRWEYPSTPSFWLYSRLLDGGDTVAISNGTFFAKFDKNSKLIWKIPIAANHDIEMLPDGTFLVPVWDLPVKYNGRMVRFDSIVHISKDGKRLGAWSTYEHLKELQKFHPSSILDPKPSRGIKGDADGSLYYHLNSIQILPKNALGLKNKNFQEGNWLICFRNVDLILILDKDTHHVVWSWGPGQLDRPHMPRMLDDGKILVFDNGMYRGYSRVVIVDPVLRKIVWQYNPLKTFYSSLAGSSQLLPNGNFLICDAMNGRAFEITPDKKIVWVFLNPVKGRDGMRQGIYRMLRVPKQEVSSWLGK